MAERQTEQEASYRKELENMRSNLSHSIRMPLAVISGYLELLALDIVSSEDEKKACFEKIRENVAYLVEVTGITLDNFEEKDIKLHLKIEKLDLSDCIRRVASYAKPLVKKREIQIEVICGEKAILIEADRIQLMKVLYNLIENSIKYMGKSGKIQISAEKKKKEVQVIFRDDGLGIAKEESEHLFEKSYTGKNHTGGNGYGLHMVQTVIEAHHGQLEVQTDRGQGMSICIRLPAVQACRRKEIV